ncbi:MAG: NADH-quinone oxidoreductase subunit L [Candidatus Omnitrophica bacterium]|nr:NADH-quinone oxidoreductase subunit L [Candidatus Omnitrophota bacterium]
MGFEFLFRVDNLAIFMACVSGAVSILIYIYSIGYMSPYKNKVEFFALMSLFVASMMGLIFSNNLLLMYVFWELTAFCSFRLIGFYRKESDLWYADKAFLVTFFGASIMLAGIILIYINYGTLNFDLLRGTQVNNLIFALMLAGIFSKSAQLPLSSWLPDAGVAPSPVTALLHAAVLVKIGVYAYARFFSDVFIVSRGASVFVLGLVIVSSLVAALSALRENNIKKILAYSTISQLAYIFVGLIINTRPAISAALLYILVHSIAKAGLFLIAGIVEQKTHTKDLNSMGGLLQIMPVAAVSFLLCAFAIIGLPPFGGFFSKFFLIIAAADAGYNFASAMLIFTAVITLLYLLRLFNGIFLGEVKTKASGSVAITMNSVVFICGVLSLLIGLFIRYPLNFVNSVSAILGR